MRKGRSSPGVVERGGCGRSDGDLRGRVGSRGGLGDAVLACVCRGCRNQLRSAWDHRRCRGCDCCDGQTEFSSGHVMDCRDQRRLAEIPELIAGGVGQSQPVVPSSKSILQAFQLNDQLVRFD